MYINVVACICRTLFLCDLRSQRYIFDVNNTIKDVPQRIFLRFFEKNVKNLFKNLQVM